LSEKSERGGTTRDRVIRGEDGVSGGAAEQSLLDARALVPDDGFVGVEAVGRSILVSEVNTPTHRGRG